MARTGAAVVLAFAVCCLLGATAPARLPVDLPRQLPDAVDRETAAEKLVPKPLADAEAADQLATVIAVPEEEGTAIAVHEEKGPVREERSSLLCLVFRWCGGGTAKPAGAGGVAVARGSSTQERQALDRWTKSAAAGTAEDEKVHGEEQGAYDSGSDWDSDSGSDWDSDCDSDEDDEGGIVEWFWRLADGF